MAIDEAILRARTTGQAPNTVRFYTWNPSAVSIGRFQNIYNEVNVENCQKHGVDIVRRISGGGAVYHDSQDEITYSVIAGKDDLGVEDATSAYNKICNGLIEALKILGITADFNIGNPKQCPNITIKGRKISGSAQSHKGKVILQHGTFLLNVNLEKMFTFLKVPWAKTCIEIVNVAKNKITSIKDEVGSDIPIKEAYISLVKGFEKAFNTQLEEGNLSLYEKTLCEKLLREKFSREEWNVKGLATFSLTNP
jgi:lipoate-protein ligase A